MAPNTRKRPAAFRQVIAKHPKHDEESKFLYTVTQKRYDGLKIIEVTVVEHKRAFKTKKEASAAARVQFYSDFSDNELQENLEVDKRARPPDTGILMRDEEFSSVCHIQKNDIVGDNIHRAVTVHLKKGDGASLTASFFTVAGEPVGAPHHFEITDKVKRLCDCVREVTGGGDVTLYSGSSEVSPRRDLASFDILVARVLQHGNSKDFYKLYTKISVSPEQQRGDGPPNCEDADLCAKLFRTKSDAADHASQLVDVQELVKDGYPAAMKCVKDRRKRPPCNGVLLRWHDTETGAYAEVHISKYSAA